MKIVKKMEKMKIVSKKSKKSKNTRKNLYLFTNGHFRDPNDFIGKTVTLTFQARSANTHFRGVVMGSHADFVENA